MIERERERKGVCERQRERVATTGEADVEKVGQSM